MSHTISEEKIATHAIPAAPGLSQIPSMARQRTKDKDRHCLREAEGWLDLGGAAEALDELNQISSTGSSSIDVLRARYSALAATDQWNCALMVSEVAVTMFPASSETWLWRAHAVRVTTRSAEKARDALSPAGDKFPDDPIILLNLALYETELGDEPRATGWLRKTHKAATHTHTVDVVRQLVQQDGHLRSLWDSVEHSAVE